MLINTCQTIGKNTKCNDCINQYEMFNLFVDDLIEKDELKRLPSLNNEEIISHIEGIKIKIKEKYGKRI